MTTYAVLDGEAPLRVRRKHRGLTQQQLADCSQIESGKRTGTSDVLGRLADALDLSTENIID